VHRVYYQIIFLEALFGGELSPVLIRALDLAEDDR
jgi:hypothetical protein